MIRAGRPGLGRDGAAVSVAGLGHTADGLYGAFGEEVAQQHPHDGAAGSGGRFTRGTRE